MSEKRHVPKDTKSWFAKTFQIFKNKLILENVLNGTISKSGHPTSHDRSTYLHNLSTEPAPKLIGNSASNVL